MLAPTKPAEPLTYEEALAAGETHALMAAHLLAHKSALAARVVARKAAGAKRAGGRGHAQSDYISVRNILAAAVRAGAERSELHGCEWDISGDCQSPRRIERFARPPAPMVRVANVEADESRGFRWLQSRYVSIDGPQRLIPAAAQAAAGDPSAAGSVWTRRGLTSLWVTQIVRCGKCAPCLALRSRKWQVRALRECSRAPRTWWVTLTIRPEIHDWIKAQAAGLFEKAFADRKPGDFDALPQDVQFAKRTAVGFEEVTRYLKRLRHTTTVGVRYLLVAEPHEGKRRDPSLPGKGENHGLPHFHMLIHETGEARLTYRVLDRKWRWGNTKIKLVNDSEAAAKGKYLCKYLSKSAASRTRASLMYGKTSSDIERAFNTHEREKSDPQMHSLTTTNASAFVRPQDGVVGLRPVVDAICETALAGTVAVGPAGRREVGLDGQLQVYSAMMHDRRTAADARLGGPGSINAFRKLAAKGHARRDPAYISASKAAHALVGHQPKPTGPLSVLDGSERNMVVPETRATRDAEGSLPDLELEDRRALANRAKDEREELQLRNAAAAVARNAPAARRARIADERERFQRQYGSAVAHPAVPAAPDWTLKDPPAAKRLPLHGYRVHTAYLRPPAKKKPRKLRRE